MTITDIQAASAIPNVVARLLVANLRPMAILPRIVGRDYDDEIASEGDRVTINKLGQLVVNTKVQGSPVTVQSPSTTPTTAILAQPEVTFSIDNVTRINARPDLMAGYAEEAAIAMARHINAQIAAIVWPLAGSTIPVGALTADTFYDADRLLNVNEIAEFNRYAVLGTDAKREALNINEFTKYENQGEQAWATTRSGILGSLGGFLAYASQGIVETAGEVKNLFYQKDAIQLVMRTPDTSMNGNNVTAASILDDGEGGTGLTFRVLTWFDPRIQEWVMTVDTLFAVAVPRPEGVVAVSTVDV